MSTSGRAAEAPVLSRWVGLLSGVGEAFRASQPFVLAGIDWHDPPGARIELRARLAGGRWTGWLNASILGHDSDRGETLAHALVGEPVWTGPADAVQLRSATPVAGLNLHLVTAAAVQEPAADTDAVAARGLSLATPRLPAGPGQPPIISRQNWAAKLLPRAAPSYGEVRVAFVHHSVNSNGYSVAEVPAMLRSIYVFHTYVRGWNDIGYNFAVDAFGNIWEARAGGIDRPVIGAQAGGYNAESFGAVLLGDFAETLPTPAASTALAHLIAWKLALHGVPPTGKVTVEVDPSDAYYTAFRPGQQVSLPRVAAHRDGCTTDCPGYDMYVNGMPPLRSSVAQLVGRQYELTLAPGPAPGSGYELAPYPIAPGTKVKPATYLELQTVTLTAGRELPVHGFLRTRAGAGLKHARITLQDLSSTRHQDSETKLSQTHTHGDGLWVALLKPQENLLLRALHADQPAAASSLVIVAVRPELTLMLERRGGGVRATGTVTPLKPHIVIAIKPAGSARRAVRQVSVEAYDGVFQTTLNLAPGRYWISAHTHADATNVAGQSPEVAANI